MPNLIATFRSFPKTLFRVNNGFRVRLRPWSSQRPIYDIVPDVANRVRPKALDPSSYRAPNGASMRPNSHYQQRLVSELFTGRDVIVFEVAKGTALPSNLVLVHERTDHYSLQPATEMTLQELNDEVTDFLNTAGRIYEREHWLRAYPKADPRTEWRKKRQ